MATLGVSVTSESESLGVNGGRLRIAISVHHYLDRNTGAPGAAMALSEALQSLGHQVELLSFDNLPGWLSTLPPAIGGRLRILSFPWFIARRLRSCSRRFDVIDLLSGDGWLLYRLKRSSRLLGGRPLLITHGAGLEHLNAKALGPEANAIRLSNGIKSFFGSLYDMFYSRYFRLWEVKLSYKLADAGLFLNHVDRAFAVEHFPMPGGRTRVTSNGIPQSLLALGEPRPSTGKKLVLAQIGSYVVAKGVHYGSQALSEILTRHSNVHIRFLGTGCSPDRVLRQFAPDLRDRIEVLPRYDRDALPRLLADCEIKLFPTLSEGFPMALVEAMACGLAPVSTMTPGPMAILESEIDGLLVPARDSRALTEALERLIADADLRLRLRTNAYRKAQGYTWEAVARHRVQIYRELSHEHSFARSRLRGA